MSRTRCPTDGGHSLNIVAPRPEGQQEGLARKEEANSHAHRFEFIRPARIRRSSERRRPPDRRRRGKARTMMPFVEGGKHAARC